MYCPYCGKQLPDGSRFCAACGAALDDPAQEPVYAPDGAQAAPARPIIRERVFLGVIGILLSVILVFVTALVCEALGIWVGIQGIILGLAVFSGYRMLGKRLGVAGTVICAVATVAAVAFVETLIWSNDVNMVYEKAVLYHAYTLKEQLDLFYSFLSEGLAGSFYLDLALAILFALAGGALLAVPDLRAYRLGQPRPRIPAGLIFFAIVLLVLACFVLFPSVAETEEPVRSHAYQTVLKFIQENLPPIVGGNLG